MSLKKIALLFCFIASFMGQAQVIELSSLAKISVLTCGSGDQLYSTFGHNAFRVHDPTIGIDVVYDYGVFDFRTKNFYVKFAQGQLDYTVARRYYSNFIKEYEFEKRWVKEQVLQLSQEEKNKLFQFLENNYLPENRAYQYDFFYNNCSTKIWDVLKNIYGDKLKLDKNYLENQYTHRELIHQNMATNSWSAFGIDLALGSVIDDLATPKEHMFLPLYVMRQFRTTQFGSKLLAANETAVYKPKTQNDKPNFFTTPLFVTLILMVIVFIITIFDYKNAKRSRGLDFTLFFITGAAGVVIFFLWFLTDHTATANNLNIVWAFPLNLIIAFLIWRKKPLPVWLRWYVLFLLLMLVLTVVLWLFKVQVFSPVIIPVLLAIGIRYIFLYFANREQNPSL